MSGEHRLAVEVHRLRLLVAQRDAEIAMLKALGDARRRPTVTVSSIAVTLDQIPTDRGYLNRWYDYLESVIGSVIVGDDHQKAP